RASSYGMYGYAMLCSESLAHAFDSAVKYHRLANCMSIRKRYSGSSRSGSATSWRSGNSHDAVSPCSTQRIGSMPFASR
ncbi:hypothetical protein A8E53_20095, partial [Burkholderia cenocepacia]